MHALHQETPSNCWPSFDHKSRSVGQSPKSFILNMGPDPFYIHAKFGEDSLKPKKVMRRKPQKLTGIIIKIKIIIIIRKVKPYNYKRTSPRIWGCPNNNNSCTLKAHRFWTESKIRKPAWKLFQHVMDLLFGVIKSILTLKLTKKKRFLGFWPFTWLRAI